MLSTLGEEKSKTGRRGWTRERGGIEAAVLQPKPHLHKYKLHKYKVHKYNVHKYKVHKYNVHKYKVHKYNVHKYNVHKYKVHKYKLHKYKVHKYELHIHKYKLDGGKLQVLQRNPSKDIPSPCLPIKYHTQLNVRKKRKLEHIKIQEGKRVWVCAHVEQIYIILIRFI